MAVDKARCPHGDIAVRANTNRIMPAEGSRAKALVLSVQVHCNTCGVEFWFPGVQTGQSYSGPATSEDGFTVTLPLIEQNSRYVPDVDLPEVIMRTGDIMKGVRR